MAYSVKLTGKNKVQALFLLEKTTQILDKIGVPYWLDGGTLLGIIREDRLLPWDDDIDLSILFSNRNDINNLVNYLKKNRLRVRVKRIIKPDIFFTGDEVRVIKIRKGYLWNLIKSKVCLEIFIRYKISDLTYTRIGNQNQVIPYKYCKNLTKISFRNRTYTIPKMTDEYLTFKYGDWKVQKKEWSVFTDDKSMQ